MRRLSDLNRTALTLTLRASLVAAFVSRHRIKFQLMAGAFALILGFVGWNLTRPPKDTWDILDNAFRTLQLITLQFPNDPTVRASIPLQIARILIPLVAVFASFQIFLASITRPVRLALLPHSFGHIIVSGPARFTQGAITALAEGGQQVVLTAADSSPAQRDALEGLGLTVLEADMAQPGTLSSLHVAQAAAVFLLAENDLDNLNTALRLLTSGVKRRVPSPLILGVRVENEALAAEMEFTLDTLTKAYGVRYHRVAPVREALRVELARAAPVFTRPVGMVSHIMVIGLKQQWQQVISELILWLQDHPTELGFLTFLVDPAEEQLLRNWLDRNPELTLLVRHAIFGCASNVAPEHDVVAESCKRFGEPHLIVILRDDEAALTTALAVRGSPSLAGSSGAILVYQSRQDFILGSLNGIRDLRGSGWRLAAIGGLIRKETIDRLLDRTDEDAAIALHDEYRVSGLSSEAANVPWGDLPESLRETNRAAIQHASVLLAAVGLEATSRGEAQTCRSLDQTRIDLMAQVEHRRWIAYQIDRGWRYGERRDPLLRTHPSMISYADLPAIEKQKAGNTATATVRSYENRGLRIGGRS